MRDHCARVGGPGGKKMIRLLIIAVIAGVGIVAAKDTSSARKNYEEGKEEDGKRFGEPDPRPRSPENRRADSK